MIYKKLTLLLVILLLVTTVSAASFVFQQGTDVNIKIPAINNNNSIADSTVSCFITIKYPNQTVLRNDTQMTFNTEGDAQFNVSMTALELSVSGDYPSTMRCDNGADFGFTSFSFEINPSGKKYIPEISGSLLFGAILTLMFMSIFLIIVANKIDLLPMKVFLMILAGIIAVLNIGFVAGSFQEFFSTNSTLSGAFGTLYVTFITLITAASFFLIVWIIVTGFKLWRIKRGFFIED